MREIIAKGHDRETVYRIINMIDRAEHKRRQIPPIIKLSHGDFGMGRRHPMVHGFRADGMQNEDVYRSAEIEILLYESQSLKEKRRL